MPDQSNQLANLDELMRHDWDQRAASMVSAQSYIIDGYHGSAPAFYDSGRRHTNDLLGALVEFGGQEQVKEWSHQTALEIGCGVGRLTIWLAAYFKQVIGTDVSGRMIDLAYDVPNVRYVCTPTLAALREPYDYVLSLIVLQHVPKSIFWRYLAEAGRYLPPGGIFHTQLHRTAEPWEPPDAETLLVRGYTPEELAAGLDQATWEPLALLEPFGYSEVWTWLTLRRR